jgi:hypothetical protein
MDADQRRLVDRRLRARVAPEGPPIGARIRPGYPADVLDISADGALVDTAHRLRPGTVVDLQVETPAYRAQVRARVVHARVSDLGADRVRYRGGLAFERALDGLASSIEPWSA